MNKNWISGFYWMLYIFFIFKSSLDAKLTTGSLNGENLEFKHWPVIG